MSHSTPQKLTRNQSLVLQSLSDAGKPLSAYAILDDLREEGLKAPLQIYRALEKLIETGRVHRLESLNAFVACAHKGCGDNDVVGFAVCEACGQVEEFTAPDVASHIRSWAGRTGFLPQKTTLEIRGLCTACQG